jgi:PelA/Pel-15E family pectate lyase
LLNAYEYTGSRLCLTGAVRAAHALLQGQLRSGGWTYRIEFNPEDRRRFAYRVDGPPGRKARDVTSLDDNTTQSAIKLLMRADRALKFKNTAIHEAVDYALDAVLAHQFESGGWPQAITANIDPKSCPKRKASFSAEWSRTYPGHRDYWYRPTLNDNLMGDLIPVLLEAAEVYQNDAYRQAALRGGEFLLDAQLPDPQPGWAQQYNYRMQPMWARKFEPPSITGGEARGVLESLMDLYVVTGEQRWLEPIPRALAYYKGSRLPNGKLARFYEMGTNKPLYFTRDYKLTYDDRAVPTHYAFQVGDWTGKAERRFEQLKTRRPPRGRPVSSVPAPSSKTARRLIDALDERGAWVEDGRLRFYPKTDSTRRIIDCATFAVNLEKLAKYVAETASGKP